jgi:glycolate oxidase FAD binding subunit
MMRRPGNVPELAALVRDAHARRTPLRIVGGGTWLGAGGAVRPDAERIELSGVAGILEYVPGDLTLTAGAGTTLAALDAATAPHGQWCPLLPWGTDDATLGAVFATATGGPFSRALGKPRDLALGLEFVDGSGIVVRAGGRVVKNVAGFDLTRLLVGSWGTLGVLTEVSVRLRARPKVDETWAVEMRAGDLTARERLSALERGPHAPLASRHLEADACGRIGLPARPCVLVRIGGNASLAAATRDAVRAVGPAEQCETSTWTRLRAVEPAVAVVVRDAFRSPISRRLKQQFDPRNILNPGIFGEAAA